MKTLCTLVLVFGVLAFLSYTFPYNDSTEPCPNADSHLVRAQGKQPLSVSPLQSLPPPVPLLNWNSHPVVDSTNRPLAKDTTVCPRVFSYQESHLKGKGYSKTIAYWQPPT